jgi:hypothetical protein
VLKKSSKTFLFALYSPQNTGNTLSIIPRPWGIGEEKRGEEGGKGGKGGDRRERRGGRGEERRRNGGKRRRGERGQGMEGEGVCLEGERERE